MQRSGVNRDATPLSKKNGADRVQLFSAYMNMNAEKPRGGLFMS